MFFPSSIALRGPSSATRKSTTERCHQSSHRLDGPRIAAHRFWCLPSYSVPACRGRCRRSSVARKRGLTRQPLPLHHVLQLVRGRSRVVTERRGHVQLCVPQGLRQWRRKSSHYACEQRVNTDRTRSVRAHNGVVERRNRAYVSVHGDVTETSTTTRKEAERRTEEGGARALCTLV